MLSYLKRIENKAKMFICIWRDLFCCRILNHSDFLSQRIILTIRLKRQPSDRYNGIVTRNLTNIILKFIWGFRIWFIQIKFYLHRHTPDHKTFRINQFLGSVTAVHPNNSSSIQGNSYGYNFETITVGWQLSSSVII